MRTAFRSLAGLIALGVLVQAAAIAGGWFGTISEIDDGATINEDYEGNFGHALHGINGMMIMPILAIALLIVSVFARKTVPGALKFGSLTFGAVALQIILAFVAFGVPAIGFLHGINAFVVFGLALMCVRRASAVQTAAAPAPGATASV